MPIAFSKLQTYVKRGPFKKKFTMSSKNRVLQIARRFFFSASQRKRVCHKGAKALSIKNATHFPL
jgi:hypothetical protein